MSGLMNDQNLGGLMMAEPELGGLMSRGYILPLGRKKDGSMTWAVPGFAMDAYDAFTLPGDVYAGHQRLVTPEGQYDPQAIKRVTDLAGMVTLGSGAIPAEGNSLRMGVKTPGTRTNAQGVVPSRKNMRELKEILRDRGPLYIRWSRGPDYDMQPGAASRDYVTGAVHDGLSAIGIRPDDIDSQVLRYIRDYSFLRAKDPKIKPHIYSGRRMGVDSDGAPSIKPTEFLGTLSDDLVALLDDENFIERLSLMERIDQNKRALEYYRSNPPQYIPVWTEESLSQLEGDLAKLGGPVMPDSY